MQRVEVDPRLHPAQLLIGMEATVRCRAINTTESIGPVGRTIQQSSARAGSIANIPDIALPVVLSRASLLEAGQRFPLREGKAEVMCQQRLGSEVRISMLGAQPRARPRRARAPGSHTIPWATMNGQNAP